MKLSVIIPSRGNINNIITILSCLKQQTFQNFNIFLIINSNLDELGYQKIKQQVSKTLNIALENFSIGAGIRDKKYNLISTVNSDFDREIKDGASYVRNYGLSLSDGEFSLFLDDDVVFNENYLQQSMDYRKTFKLEIGKDFVLTPTLMYRKTGEIQNQGFKKYIFRQSRPQVNFLKKNQKFGFIQLYSGNSLLAPTYLFKKFKFDTDMNFVAEDLDFTYSIHIAGRPIIVLSDLMVYHMERDKSILENAWVGNPSSAYQKARNRIIFVKKHGNFVQKLIFYVFGLHANNIRLLLKIIKYSKGKERKQIIISFIKGNINGLFKY